MQRIFGLAFILLFVGIIPVFSQIDTFEGKYQAALADKPPDLTFNLRLASDKTQFQQGEIIPLELSFSSPSPNKYSFNNTLGDRSGRLMIDNFIIDKPEGVIDPLSDYYEKSFMVFIGGGLSSSSMLDVKPRIINFELNEWRRFEKVGKYRLYISARRVYEVRDVEEIKKPVSAISNIIEFEIIPANKDWQHETFANAVQILNSKLSEREYQPACRTLRFLGTKEAAGELIRRLTSEDKTCFFDFHLGLQASPHRKFIVKNLLHILDSPEYPVNAEILRSLALLSFFLNNPKPLPPYPKGDEPAMKSWLAAAEVLRYARESEYKKYTARLELAVKNKTVKALPVSLDTLFNNYDSNRISNERESLIRVFADLPEERKQIWLLSHWKEIKSPSMIPILRDIYSSYETGDRSDSQIELRDLALRRLYDLDPAEGRKLILAEMRRPKVRVRDIILTLLPDKEMPELEELWFKKATDISKDYRERESALKMIERYGTSRLLKPLQTLYENQIGQTSCIVQQNVLNYFLKQDRQLGARLVKTAIDERAKTGCYNSVFETLTQKYWSVEIEQMAVSYLNDANIGVVKETVDALGKYGSPEIKEKIQRRFEQFNKEPQNDTQVKTKTYHDRSYSLQTLEQSFVNAIAKSSNWLIDENELTKLSQLCKTKNCQNEIDGLKKSINKRDISFYLDPFEDGEPRFTIAQYENLPLKTLKDKLAQFPAGTVFKWNSSFKDNTDQRRFEELKNYLQAKGLKLIG